MNIKELIQYIQSANINFMIGSGASKPYLATLGPIEEWLTRLAEDKKGNKLEYDVVEASIYKAFYKSISDYFKHPSKYKGKPKLPKYKDKNGLNIAIFTNQCSTIDKNGYLKLSKELTLKSVRTTILKKNFR